MEKIALTREHSRVVNTHGERERERERDHYDDYDVDVYTICSILKSLMYDESQPTRSSFAFVTGANHVLQIME